VFITLTGRLGTLPETLLEELREPMQPNAALRAVFAGAHIGELTGACRACHEAMRVVGGRS